MSYTIGWISECCEASPVGDMLDEGNIPYELVADLPTYLYLYGGPSGFCSSCKDTCIFALEDMGEPFDTQEEKRGER
jgi:hypothetical protein